MIRALIYIYAQAGTDAFIWCALGAVLDLIQIPVSWMRYGWDEWGGWTGSLAGLLVGIIVGVLSFALKTITAVLDFCLKLLEGVKVSESQ